MTEVIDKSLTKRIGITIGDPAGIGPELALRVAANWPLASKASLVLIGDRDLLSRVGQALGMPCPPIIAENQLREHCSGVATLSFGSLVALEVISGQWSSATGEASYQWVRFAVEAAMRGDIDAIVTGPIQKEAWHAAGIRFPGHTELLAEMTGTEEYQMMLTSPEISCVLVTIHLPLADVAASLTIENVYQSIKLGFAALSRSLGRPARVTVCGLNPHAGENGMFSHREEERIISPAIARAQAAGMIVTGPMSPDTAFVPAHRKKTDVYVCMYHDQGLIPLKALAFDDAVNVTLGLPIVRTSVDHGTAMDIAWRGIACDKSLRAAIQMAIDLA
jgi:4-hydroxythreonine-4-phosphate dehydrogenase